MTSSTSWNLVSNLARMNAELCSEIHQSIDTQLYAGAGTVWVDQDAEFTGNTALMNAATNNHLPVVKYLLERNADVDRQCELEQTALIKAAGFGHLAITQHLLEHSADVHMVDHRAMSAFHYACEHGHTAVVAHLLQAGCAQETLERDGRSGRELAQLFGRAQIVDILGGTPLASVRSAMVSPDKSPAVAKRASKNAR